MACEVYTKKTEGAGIMVSAFVDEIRGFGTPITVDGKCF